MDIKVYLKDLDDIAKREVERLWEMRDSLDCVSEATLPILIQYGVTYSLIQKLTASMDITGDSKELDKSITRLDKMQKILIQYTKLLKLDKVKENEPKNKFAQFLMKKK